MPLVIFLLVCRCQKYKKHAIALLRVAPTVTFFFHRSWPHLEIYICIYIYNMAYMFWHSILTFYLTFYSDLFFCHYVWHPFYSDILSGIYSDIFSGIHSGIFSDILSGIYSDILSGIYSGILSSMYSGIYLSILSDILFWQDFLWKGASGWKGFILERRRRGEERMRRRGGGRRRKWFW